MVAAWLHIISALLQDNLNLSSSTIDSFTVCMVLGTVVCMFPIMELKSGALVALGFRFVLSEAFASDANILQLLSSKISSIGSDSETLDVFL